MYTLFNLKKGTKITKQAFIVKSSLKLNKQFLLFFKKKSKIYN